MMKKTTPKIQEIPLSFLEGFSKIIAFVVCFGLLLASSFIVYQSFVDLFNHDIKQAVQDGLFVLILLEMFYITRSFIRFGSINVSIVVSVGIIAAVKEMIFQLDSLTMHSAIGFGVIFTTLTFTYYTERVYHQKVIKTKA